MRTAEQGLAGSKIAAAWPNEPVPACLELTLAHAHGRNMMVACTNN